LSLAQSKNLKTIAFPAISTGVYGYPTDLAAKEAISEVKSFLEENKNSFQAVHFVLFDKASFELYHKSNPISF